MAHVLAKELRDAVLQAAMSGKLTEQLSTDTPVEETLKQITKEKDKLIKEKKIKKDKPLPEIDEDEVPFDIPESWGWVRFGFVSTYASSKEKVNAKNIIPETWVLDLEDIEKGGKLLAKKRAFQKKAIGDKTCFCKGDILYSKLRPYLRKILIADEKGVCTTELVPFQMYGGISAAFVLIFLKSPNVDRSINQLTYGIKMPRVGTETMQMLCMPLPPVEEQARIVAKVDELMAKIDEYEKLENQLVHLKEQFPKDMKDSLLQAGMMGKLTERLSTDIPVEETLKQIAKEKDRLIKEKRIKKDKPLPEIDEDEAPFDIPKSWAWTRNANIARFVNGRAYKKEELLSSGKYPILRVGNLFTNEKWYFSNMELDTDKYCENGDLIYAWSASFGPTIWHGDKVIYHYHIWKVVPSQYISSNYLYYSLLSDTASIRNQSHGLGFVFVTKQFIESRLIPLPPIEEQARIVAKLDQLLPLVESLEVN